MTRRFGGMQGHLLSPHLHRNMVREANDTSALTGFLDFSGFFWWPQAMLKLVPEGGGSHGIFTFRPQSVGVLQRTIRQAESALERSRLQKGNGFVSDLSSSEAAMKP